MIITQKPEAEPCPEFQGRAVCVDVTEPRPMSGPFGTEMKFFITFEVDMDRENPPENWCTRHTVRTQPLAVTTGKKSNLRKFLNQWFGAGVLSEDNFNHFDTETLLGRPAYVMVEQEKKEDKTYARLVICTAHKGKDPLKPSGTYTRDKDREDGDGHGGGGGQAAGGKSSKGSTFRSSSGAGPKKTDRVPTPAEIAANPAEIKVHVGKCKNQELRNLEREDIERLIERFLIRDFPALEKPTAADIRLKLALQAYVKKFAREDAAGEGSGGDEGEEESENESAVTASDY
jgi:hypothetical protein